MAAASREYDSAVTSRPGRPVTATCPSVSAYRRHLRHGEDGEACGCHAAYLARQRDYYQQRKQRGLIT